MNWPGSGDKYYTAEGGVRRGFYGVNAVPDIFINGSKTSASQSAVQNAINNGYGQPAQATITGNFKVVGNSITITGSVTPAISGSGYQIYVIVNEKSTTKNKGGNGESEFFHVMMKMFPDGSGSSVTLTEGTEIPFNYTYDMSTTHVEEMDDLEVVVFVQNASTRAILNAAYMEDISLPAPQNMVATQAEINKLDVNITWSPPSGVTSNGYNVYREGVKINTSLVTTTSYQDIAPEYGKIYNYAVGAIISGDEGYWARDTVLTNAIVPTPINVTAKQTQGMEILVEWEMPEGFDLPVKYKVYRGITLLTPEPISETSLITTGAAYNTEYCFQIKPFLNDLTGGASDKACVTLTELSVSETDKDALFTLYPNPTDGLLVVSSEYRVEGIEIFDMMGRKVQSLKFNVQSSEFLNPKLETLNISNLPAGVYIIRITTEKGSAEKRLIKN
jgi:hypothetical protein